MSNAHQVWTRSNAATTAQQLGALLGIDLLGTRYLLFTLSLSLL